MDRIEADFAEEFRALTLELITQRVPFADGVAALRALEHHYWERSDVPDAHKEAIRRAIGDEEFFFALRRDEPLPVCADLLDRITWRSVPEFASLELSFCGHFLRKKEFGLVVGRLEALVERLLHSGDNVHSSQASGQLARAQKLLADAHAEMGGQ